MHHTGLSEAMRPLLPLRNHENKGPLREMAHLPHPNSLSSNFLQHISLSSYERVHRLHPLRPLEQPTIRSRKGNLGFHPSLARALLEDLDMIRMKMVMRAMQ